MHPALGTEQQFLGHGGGLYPAFRISQELSEEFRLRHQRLALHVAGRETIHRVGHRDQGERADLVADRRQIGGFLRIAPEQDGVTRRQQRIDVVVSGHDIERVPGYHPGCDLQHETAHLLAHCHIVGFKTIEDSLAGRGVGDIFAPGERRTQGAALRRMLTLGFEEKGVLTPDIAPALRTKGFKDLRDFR